MRLFIAAPDIWPGDAVGNHCMSFVRSAQRLGYEARAFAQRSAGDVSPIDELLSADKPGGIAAEDTLLVSYSIHDPLLDQLLALPGRKLCYFHGVTSPELLREFEPVTADLCERSFEQFAQLKKFDVLIANSHVTAQTLTPYMSIDDVRVLPPVSADMAVFSHVPRKHEKSPDAPFEILVVGRVVPHKRIEDAIEVLAQVRERGVNARLSIVGSAPNRTYLAFLVEHARALGVDAHVEFRGMLDDASLFRAFDSADALLSVSQHEGFCVPVLEAMHLGLPALVRAGTAASEVGTGAAPEFATLDAASDALCDLHANPSRVASLAEVGRRRAAELLAQTCDEVFGAILMASR
ncbi:glycosyltransferase family 4 protein [Paraburkholderia sp. PREW-6R]|uniref:glycosyltransferase family 4 protein n=1 Tax=Paraburkholderia sp. PREW-6R TaxID=3141544 RepID=UPI0031F4DB5E